MLTTLEELLMGRTAIMFPKTDYVIWLKSHSTNIVYWVFLYPGIYDQGLERTLKINCFTK